MKWELIYRGHVVSGYDGCEAVVVSLSSATFEWDIFCKSVRSAKLHISRHIAQQQLGE